MNILLFGWGCALACLNTKVEESSKYWSIIPLKRFPPPPLFQQGPSLMLEEGEAELRSGCLRYFESGGRETGLGWPECQPPDGPAEDWNISGTCVYSGMFPAALTEWGGSINRRAAQVTGSREGRLRRKWSEGSHFSLTWKLKSEPLVRARY